VKRRPKDRVKTGVEFADFSNMFLFLLTRGVSHCGLAIYILKYLKAKEELWKLKYFTI
jgi:hypothetical protein